MTDREDQSSKEPNSKESIVSPAEFELFLAWACKDLTLPFVPAVRKSYIDFALGYSTSRKALKFNKELVAESTGSTWNLSHVLDQHPSPSIYIDSIYDRENLVQLKILRNKKIPCQLIKLIALTVPFHIHLSAIYINRGLDQNGLYQLAQLLTKSNITEMILDNTSILEANYYLLLENNSRLKSLSLARCSLNDDAVKEIASRLHFPSNISEHLSILNLTSNKITDEGAKYLGEMLRTNRKLTYLNLSGNMITATGADYIFNSLMTFKLTKAELLAKHERQLQFYKEKQILEEIERKRRMEMERKMLTAKSTLANKKGNKEAVNDPDMMYDNDKPRPSIKIGALRGPFTPEDVTVVDGIVYCHGNNILSYLNLAYNNLTYFSVKKLYEVLRYQRKSERHPKGLVSVCIDGNNIPVTCTELKEINVIIDNILSTKPVIDRRKVPQRKK